MQMAFRVDASSRIGTGHVMRCLTLAQALRDKGAECLFVHRSHSGNMADRIRAEGFPILELPPPERAADEAEDAAYVQWLGVPQAQDAEETRAVLAGCEPDWLVVDHYALDAEWESALYDTVGRIAVLDDLANRPHDCNVLVDQNYFSDPEGRYSGWLPSRCQLLTGPRYALLLPEYAQLRRLRGPRRGPPSRVLVFYGGVDPTNETARALRVLSRPQFRHLAVDVVVGANNPHCTDLEAMAADRPQTEVHRPRPHLAGLMAEADLALGAGGTTTWERCAAGLPAVVTAVAENQEPFNQALAQDGVIRYLGRYDAITDDDPAAALAGLVDDPAALRALAGRAWRITDALGALRVAEALLPTDTENLALRSARAEDKDLYFDWVNDPEVRRNALQSASVAWSTRDRWFEECLLRDPNTTLWVMITPQGLPVGQVRVVREDGEAVLDYSLDLAFRGRGWGRRLLELAVTAWMEQGQDAPLVGSVLPANVASQRAFLRAGCVEAETDSVRGGGALSITVLSDRTSWINTWVPGLLAGWLSAGYRVRWVHRPEAIVEGDLCFLLGCGQRVASEQLAKHRNTLVVHESDLPKGRGWSPLSWQVLEGAERIPVTLLEAVDEVDAGDIYMQEWLELDGTELIDELRAKQGRATLELCRRFVAEYPRVLERARPQEGEPTWYPRRRPEDSELDPDRTLREQFDLLRVVDNERYPAFFEWRGQRYNLHITRAQETR